MPRKKKPSMLSAEEFADALRDNPAFSQVIEQAYIAYVQTGGIRNAVTISVGGAEYEGLQTLAGFINAADASLYRAKNNGRNRVGF